MRKDYSMAQTLERYGAYYNRLVCEFCGLSTDKKPIKKFNISPDTVIYIQNGSIFYEMDSIKQYLYDSGSHNWHEI